MAATLTRRESPAHIIKANGMKRLGQVNTHGGGKKRGCGVQHSVVLPALFRRSGRGEQRPSPPPHPQPPLLQMNNITVTWRCESEPPVGAVCCRAVIGLFKITSESCKMHVESGGRSCERGPWCVMRLGGELRETTALGRDL